jgi:ribosomal protein S18
MAFAPQAGGARRPFFRRRKTCPFSGANAPKIDYKDTKLLQRYVSERGKIVAARARTGDQACALSRSPALRDPLGGFLRRLGGSGMRYRGPREWSRRPMVGADVPIRL